MDDTTFNTIALAVGTVILVASIVVLGVKDARATRRSRREHEAHVAARKQARR